MEKQRFLPAVSQDGCEEEEKWDWLVILAGGYNRSNIEHWNSIADGGRGPIHWAKLFSVPEMHPCGTPIDTLKLRWQVIVDITCVCRSKLKVVKKRDKRCHHTRSVALSLFLSLSSSCILSSPQSQSPQLASLSDTFNFVCPDLDPAHSHHLLCILPDSHHHRRRHTAVFPHQHLSSSFTHDT